MATSFFYYISPNDSKTKFLPVYLMASFAELMHFENLYLCSLQHTEMYFHTLSHHKDILKRIFHHMEQQLNLLMARSTGTETPK